MASDGRIQIDFDMDLGALQSDAEKAKSLIKGTGDGAGDELQKNFNANAEKITDDSAKASKSIHDDFSKTVKGKIEIIANDKDIKETKEQLKSVPKETVAKLRAQAEKAGITDFDKLLAALPKEKRTELLAKAERGEVINFEKLLDEVPKKQVVDLKADAETHGIDNFDKLLKSLPKKMQTELRAKAEKGEAIDYEDLLRRIPAKKVSKLQLNDNASPELRKIQSEADQTSNRLSRLKEITAGSFLGNLASSGLQAVGGFLQNMVGQAMDASDAIYKFKSTMRLGGFGEKEIDTATKKVKKYADDTVYDLDTVSNMTAQLGANGIKNYEGLTEAAGNLNAQAGGTADTMRSVALVMTQTAGAGKLTTENWNQMMDAIPGASGKLQQAMLKNGAYTGNFRDAMQKGQITSDEFFKAIEQLGTTQGAVKAAKSTQTFEGAIGNMEASVVTKMNNVINAFGKDKLTKAIGTAGNVISGFFDVMLKGLGWLNAHSVILGTIWSDLVKIAKIFGQSIWKTVSGLVSGISEAFESVGKKAKGSHDPLAKIDNVLKSIAEHPKAIQAVANALLALVAIKGLLVVAKGIKAIATAIAFFTANPIVLVIAAVVALAVAVATLVVAIVKNWSTIKKKTSKIWHSIAKYLSGVWKSITKSAKSWYNGVKNGVSSAWKSVKKTTSSIWNGIKSFFGGVWSGIKKVVSSGYNSVKNGVSSAWNAVSRTTRSIWNGISGFFGGIWSGIKHVASSGYNAVKNGVSSAWHAVSGVFHSVWNGIKGFFGGVWGGIKGVAKAGWGFVRDGVKGALDSVSSHWHSVWKGISGFFGDIWSGIKSTAKGGMNGVIGWINKGISGIDSIIHTFGGKKHAISLIPKFAKGTSGAPRGLAMVNDGNGPEGIIDNHNQLHVLSGRNRLVAFEGGETVIPHEGMQSMFGVNKFAGGTKGWLSDVGEWFKDKWDGLTNFIKHPIKALEGIMNKAIGGVGKSAEFVADFTPPVGHAVVTGIEAPFKKMLSSLKKKHDDEDVAGQHGNPSGAGVQRWKKYVEMALKANGLSTSDGMINKVLRQIATESGGNPKAVQGNIGDINNKTGDLAKGLMQTISSTFNANAFAGHHDIFNGYDNLLAALKYAKNRYGSSLSYLGNGHGYANGGHVLSPQLAPIGEDGDEFVINGSKASADGLIEQAIFDRARKAPNSMSAQLAGIFRSVKNSNGTIVTPRVAGNAPQIGVATADAKDYTTTLSELGNKLDAIVQKQVKVDGSSFARTYESYGSAQRTERTNLNNRGVAVNVNI